MASQLTQARERAMAAVRPNGRLGLQIYASIGGEPFWHEAFGEFRPGEPLSVSHLMPWMCAGKPLTVIALAQLFDQGLLATDRRVAEIIPEFGAGGKQNVTIEHLLAHLVIYTGVSEAPWLSDRATALKYMCDLTIDGEPGKRAAYNAYGSWLVLSEIVQRISGADYYEFLRERILNPLGMTRTAAFLGTGFDNASLEVPSEALFVRKPDGSLEPMKSFPDEERWPGTEMWGPVADLARPLEAIVAGGVYGGQRLLSKRAIDHFCKPFRVGVGDEYFQGLDIGWGRGFCTEPGWFGAPSGARIVGHSGYITVTAMADFDRELVIAYIANTTVAEPLLRTLENLLIADIYRAL